MIIFFESDDATSTMPGDRCVNFKGFSAGS